jgi:lysozyme
MASKSTTKKGGLVAIVGAIAASLLLSIVPADESGRKVEVTVSSAGEATVRHVSGPQYLKAYRDLAGIATACDGITRGVKMGQTYTEAQCGQLLDQELVAHALDVQACVPQLWQPGRDRQRAAAISLAYNIGTNGFCGSTAAKRFRAGRWREACDAFLMWNKAGRPLKVVRGLTARRGRERALCLQGVA